MIALPSMARGMHFRQHEMAAVGHTTKTCQRCGRSGSHAFRRTPDGLYECTTTTACRARARRGIGSRQNGRGRPPRPGGLTAVGPGVAYVIGEDGPQRAGVEASLRAMTDLAVAAGPPNKVTLTSLGSRNVKVIAVAASCLGSIGFRNEFTLRRRQPRLRTAPLLLYGDRGEVEAVLQLVPGASLVGIDRPEVDIATGLRARAEA